MVRNWNTDSISVEDPVVRASEADLVIPIPIFASKVRRFGVIGVREDTFSFFEVISFIARRAVSVFKVFFAVI